MGLMRRYGQGGMGAQVGRAFRGVALAATVVAVTVVPASPAAAVFHLSMIREVFAGSAEQPNAQFIELQMYAGNQNFVVGERVAVFDAAGTEVGSFVFTSNMANGEDQSYILVATPDAEAFFDVEADLEMTPVIVRGGGSVCFGNSNPPVDCASWGGYSGDDSETGTPFNSPVGLVPGQSMTRKIEGGSDAEKLDEGDDTNDSAADFEMTAPTPTSNTADAGSATQHARSITLKLEKALVARGRVSVEDDFEACAGDVPVVVQRRGQGRWAKVGRTTTSRTGRYRVELRDRPGRYRAVAPAVQPSEEHGCSKAVSRRRVHR